MVVTTRSSALLACAVPLIVVAAAVGQAPRIDLALVNDVDEHVFAKLDAARIPPSPPTGDRRFVRRVFLDAIGRLPTADEVQSFVENPRMDKRSRLIDELLRRPEFADYWTLLLAEQLQNRSRRGLEARGAEGVRSMHQWLRRQVAANRPWDELARDVLTAEGDSLKVPQIGYYIVASGEASDDEESRVASSVGRAFLGTRIGCAKCHDHPHEEITQDDFYRFAAFFTRMKLERRNPDEGPTELSVAGPQRPQARQPKTGELLSPRPFDGTEMELAAGGDPRESLVDWMTSADNEYFSGNMVNRLWKHYMKVGLVEPFDDLRPNNPPSNRPVWKFLNREFVESGYDLKHVMRLILNSQVYQLSSETLPENAPDDRDFSHYYPKRIRAEVLADAMSDVTGVPDEFPGYPRGTRTVQIAESDDEVVYLLTTAPPTRETAADACERDADAAPSQGLHIVNSETLSKKLTAMDGWLMRTLAEEDDDERMIHAIFLRTVARPAAKLELERMREHLAATESREDAFVDLLWAVINTREFLFNQ